jgi:hypothetical protein
MAHARQNAPSSGVGWNGLHVWRVGRYTAASGTFPQYAFRRLSVKELIRYLLENIYVDFQGEISLDKVRHFLREDQSREAKQLLQKLIEDKGVDDLLIALADILKEHIQTGINEQIVKENLVTYSEA